MYPDSKLDHGNVLGLVTVNGYNIHAIEEQTIVCVVIAYPHLIRNGLSPAIGHQEALSGNWSGLQPHLLARPLPCADQTQFVTISAADIERARRITREISSLASVSTRNSPVSD